MIRRSTRVVALLLYARLLMWAVVVGEVDETFAAASSDRLDMEDDFFEDEDPFLWLWEDWDEDEDDALAADAAPQDVDGDANVDGDADVTRTGRHRRLRQLQLFPRFPREPHSAPPAERRPPWFQPHTRAPVLARVTLPPFLVHTATPSIDESVSPTASVMPTSSMEPSADPTTSVQPSISMQPSSEPTMSSQPTASSMPSASPQPTAVPTVSVAPTMTLLPTRLPPITPDQENGKPTLYPTRHRRFTRRPIGTIAPFSVPPLSIPPDIYDYPVPPVIAELSLPPGASIPPDIYASLSPAVIIALPPALKPAPSLPNLPPYVPDDVTLPPFLDTASLPPALQDETLPPAKPPILNLLPPWL